MKYLLDTHIMIWAIIYPEKLSARVKKILANTDNQIIVSSISFWEIAIKFSSGRLDLSNIIPEDFPPLCQKLGFSISSLGAADSSSYHQLTATHHKDPFDRMLIWIAINNNYTLISDDKLIQKYQAEGLKITW